MSGYAVHPDRYSLSNVLVRKNRIVLHTAESSEGNITELTLLTLMTRPGDRVIPNSDPPRMFGAAYLAIPDTKMNTYREGPGPKFGVYAQGGANKDSWSFCFPGRASQTRAEWLDPYSRECIRIAAHYIVDKSRIDDIPIRRLTWQQVAAGERGYCDHYAVSLAFKQSDHTDVGPNFPWDVLAADIAEILTPTSPPPEDEGGSMYKGLVKHTNHDAIYATYSGGYKVWLPNGKAFDVFRYLKKLEGAPINVTICDTTVMQAIGPIVGPVPPSADIYGVPA